MHFLPDVYVPCEICHGARYNRDTLEITFRGKTIADVLDLSCEEALGFFAKQPPIARHMQTLVDVGLGYVRLGQPAPTLSGGEAQRVKLASELSRRPTGHTFYVLDEPTTGLHFEDTRRLLEVLGRLVEQGNTVVVIEHNLDVIKTADWIIDLGPEGGNRGGTVVAEGTPEQVAKTAGSYTGEVLKPVLARAKATPTRESRRSGDGQHPLQRHPGPCGHLAVDLNPVAHLAGHQALEDPGQMGRIDAGHGRAGADEGVQADDGLVGRLVVEALDQVDLGGHADHRPGRGRRHAADQVVGRAHQVGHLHHVVGALGVHHHDAVGVLGPEGRHMLGPEALVHRAVALPQQQGGPLTSMSLRPPRASRGFQTRMSAAP